MALFPEFLTAAEAARYLDIPLSAVDALISKDRLPVVKIRGHLRVHRAALDERRERFQWQKLDGQVAMVNLDGLSSVVMGKAAQRFRLKTKAMDCGDDALHAIAQNECSVLLLNEDIPDMVAWDCYAQLRGLNRELPIVVMCQRMIAEDYRRFLFHGGPVTFLHNPAQYLHAERLFRQLGFKREAIDFSENE